MICRLSGSERKAVYTWITRNKKTGYHYGSRFPSINIPKLNSTNIEFMIDIAKLFKDPTFKFSPQEFVHPSIITSVGLERCLYYISDFQVNYAMLLREILQAPVIINTWHYKKPGPGYYVGRGTRPRSYIVTRPWYARCRDLRRR